MNRRILVCILSLSLAAVALSALAAPKKSGTAQLSALKGAKPLTNAQKLALVRSYSKLVKGLDTPVTLGSRRTYLGPHAYLSFNGVLDPDKDLIWLTRSGNELDQLRIYLRPKVAGKPILIDAFVEGVFANSTVEIVAPGTPTIAITLANVRDRGHLNVVFTPTSKAQQIITLRPRESSRVYVLSIQVTPTL